MIARLYIAIATISTSPREDEMMHGEGMLCWSDDFGVCRYKVVFCTYRGPSWPMFSECPLVPQGTFEHNVFQGHGVLEWSVKAEHVRVIN